MFTVEILESEAVAELTVEPEFAVIPAGWYEDVLVTIPDLGITGEVTLTVEDVETGTQLMSWAEVFVTVGETTQFHATLNSDPYTAPGSQKLLRLYVTSATTGVLAVGNFEYEVGVVPDGGITVAPAQLIVPVRAARSVEVTIPGVPDLSGPVTIEYLGHYGYGDAEVTMLAGEDLTVALPIWASGYAELDVWAEPSEIRVFRSDAGSAGLIGMVDLPFMVVSSRLDLPLQIENGPVQITAGGEYELVVRSPVPESFAGPVYASFGYFHGTQGLYATQEPITVAPGATEVTVTLNLEADDYMSPGWLPYVVSLFSDDLGSWGTVEFEVEILGH